MIRITSLVLFSCLLASGQDPAAESQPPTKSAIEEERKASEQRIQTLQQALEAQKDELERQKGLLTQLEGRLKEQKGFVTKDEFLQYQQAVGSFQKTLADNLRKQEDIERTALEARLRTEQALFENAEAALLSLMTNLNGVLNTGNTTRALIQLPNPVTGSPRYNAALKGLEEQSKKKKIPSLAPQLAAAVPQVAWLSTAVTVAMMTYQRNDAQAEANLRTLVCARDFAEAIEGSKRARIAELDSLIDRLGKLRERMQQNRARMQDLAKSAVPGQAKFQEASAAMFAGMRPKPGETPSQALSALDERLRNARREIATARALLGEYRQMMEAMGEYQTRLRGFIETHARFECTAAEPYVQDVSKSLASLTEAARQFREMQTATEAQEPVRVLDSVL